MSGKKTLIALSAALALGIIGASTAQASDHEDQSGGFRIGPLGQIMGAPSGWRTRGSNAFGFVSPAPYYAHPRSRHYHY